jgi:soluble lytic murein transglycosylase-like protein
VAKYCYVMLCCIFAGQCLAGEPMASDMPVKNPSVQEFEQQVRDIAEKTAAEERAQKEQAHIAKRLADAPQGAANQPFKVFRYQKNGAVMFADRVPLKTPYQLIIYNSCYACSINSNIDWYGTKLYLTEFADNISQAAALYHVEPAFVRAIIHAESAFNPLARSRKGAMGLMQLMPNTAQDMGVSNCSDPQQNIHGGVKYLAKLLRIFNGNQSLAAAAYNAGPNAVNRHNGIPPYEETQTYVKRVNILLQRYKSQIVLANK